MYQKEFRQLLLKGNIPHALLLYGKNEYFIEAYIEYYQKKLDATESMLTLYFDEYDYTRAKAYLSQSSLFGGTNLLLIRSDKKILAKELDSLIELTKRNSDNYLLLYFSGEDSVAKAMQKSFTEKKGGIWVRFFESNLKDGLKVLRAKSKSLNIKSDEYTLTHLLNLLDNNLALAVKELEKLSILDEPLNTKVIDNMVYSTAPLAVEKLLIELFNKNPIDDIFERLLELGFNEFDILRATEIFINQIFLFHLYIDLNGRANSQDILGYRLPRQIEEQRATLATRIKLDNWNKIYNHILNSELRLKKDKSQYKEAELYGILIQLQQYI